MEIKIKIKLWRLHGLNSHYYYIHSWNFFHHISRNYYVIKNLIIIHKTNFLVVEYY